MAQRKTRKTTVLRLLLAVIIGAAMVGMIAAATWGHPMPVLDTHGVVADQERNLIYVTTGLGLLVVVPVLVMLFVIAWKYRDTNQRAEYQPDYASNLKVEAVWWGIPIVIILALAVITGYSTHALDPYKPLNSSVKPITIQVVALQWRWLFIYPDQKVATISQAVIPANTPINLSITSDAPMNSFWVPALAGQVYAMSGMSTQLHLMANDLGTYKGTSANISGSGFAGMTFSMKAVSDQDFSAWTRQAAQSPQSLTASTYTKLAQPSTYNQPMTFMLGDSYLYNEIIMKTMGNH